MRFFPLLALLGLAALGGCGPSGTVYAPPASDSGRLCTARCSEKNNNCRGDCDLDNRRCLNQAQADALVAYENYMSQQFLHANAIDRSAHDFENLAPCENAMRACTAACETPYEACYEGCGGKVEKGSGCLLCF
jgi:predicted small lipoprotein YifL